MRKGLFNFITIAKGAHYFACMLVRITNDDFIRKDGGGWGDERRRMDVNTRGARVGSRDGLVQVDRWWSGRLCCSLSEVGKFFRCLIRCRLLSLFGRTVRYFGFSRHRVILIIRNILQINTRFVFVRLKYTRLGCVSSDLTQEPLKFCSYAQDPQNLWFSRKK